MSARSACRRHWPRNLLRRRRDACTCPPAITQADRSPTQRDFSVVVGGPLFQLLRRAHLSDDALSLVRQRVVVITLLAWLPLLILSSVEGHVLGGSVALPFLIDAEAHVRFLVALPLLIIAELVVHRRMRSNRRSVPGTASDSATRDSPRFDDAIASDLRLRNSVLAEVLLIALVYGVGVLVIWRTLRRARQRERGTRRRRATEPNLSLAGTVVRLREPADLPVPVVPLVFPIVHLGTVPLAGIAHRFGPGPHASGPCRRAGLSQRRNPGLHGPRCGARRIGCRKLRQSHFLRGRSVDGLQGRDRGA